MEDLKIAQEILDTIKERHGNDIANRALKALKMFDGSNAYEYSWFLRGEIEQLAQCLSVFDASKLDSLKV